MIANGLPSILWWASDYQRKLEGQFRKRGICQKHSWQWIHARTRLFKVTVTVPIVLSKGCCQRQYWLSWRGSKCWWGFPSVFSHQALFADLVTFGSSLAVSFSSADLPDSVICLSLICNMSNKRKLKKLRKLKQ